MAATTMPTMSGTAAMTTTAGMAGMDHSGTGGMSGTGTMTATTGMGGMNSAAPYDAQFIDSMLMHHKGAVTMAQQALKEAEHPEIKTLAANIVKTQQAEIAQMETWRKQWYPDLAPTQGVGMDMGTMEASGDTSTPFDQRFLAAMTPHHQGAIAMAKDAQQKAEHPEIKTLAAAIITAQEAEIAQMQGWQQQWYAK